MHETAAELVELQALLDRSYAGAGPHLRTIIDPVRRMGAEELVELMSGLCLITVATVTADGRPLSAPADGYFLHGKVEFSLGHDSVRARHLAQRPQCSVSWLPGVESAVTVHGRAELFDVLDPEQPALKQAMLDHYLPLQGEGFRRWLDNTGPLGVRVMPDRMFTFNMRSN